jgi:hypothetical protein
MLPVLATGILRLLSDSPAAAYTGIDLLLNQLLRQLQLPQLHLTPDLVQHMGVMSSSRSKNQGDFRKVNTSPSFTE